MIIKNVQKRNLEFMAIDEIDNDLVLISAEIIDNEDKPYDVANNIINEAAGLFTDLSLLMKKLMIELSTELRPYFPEIAGGALLAQVEVLKDSLKNNKEGLEAIDRLGQGLAEKAIEALTRKRNRS